MRRDRVLRIDADAVDTGFQPLLDPYLPPIENLAAGTVAVAEARGLAGADDVARIGQRVFATAHDPLWMLGDNFGLAGDSVQHKIEPEFHPAAMTVFCQIAQLLRRGRTSLKGGVAGVVIRRQEDIAAAPRLEQLSEQQMREAHGPA